jgi:hypothetical protein
MMTALAISGLIGMAIFGASLLVILLVPSSDEAKGAWVKTMAIVGVAATVAGGVIIHFVVVVPAEEDRAKFRLVDEMQEEFLLRSLRASRSSALPRHYYASLIRKTTSEAIQATVESCDGYGKVLENRVYRLTIQTYRHPEREVVSYQFPRISSELCGSDGAG